MQWISLDILTKVCADMLGHHQTSHGQAIDYHVPAPVPPNRQQVGRLTLSLGLGLEIE